MTTRAHDPAASIPAAFTPITAGEPGPGSTAGTMARPPARAGEPYTEQRPGTAA